VTKKKNEVHGVGVKRDFDPKSGEDMSARYLVGQVQRRVAIVIGRG
jgi:hypothetical protein